MRSHLPNTTSLIQIQNPSKSKVSIKVIVQGTLIIHVSETQTPTSKINRYQIHNPAHTKRSWLPQTFLYAKTSWMTTNHYINLEHTLAAPRNSTKVHRHHPLSTTRLEGWPQGVTDNDGSYRRGWAHAVGILKTPNPFLREYSS